jgi:hypothetical protein
MADHERVQKTCNMTAFYQRTTKMHQIVTATANQSLQPHLHQTVFYNLNFILHHCNII